MSGSVLKIYVTAVGDAHALDQDETFPNWVVAVAHPDGRVLNWSLGRYRYHDDDPWIPMPANTGPNGTPGNWYESIPVRDGHVQIEVPPGMYLVRATMHTWFQGGSLFGNWATDRGLVQVCCGDATCVWLFAPSLWQCSVELFEHVYPLMLKNKQGDPRKLEQAIKLLKEIAPKEVPPFEAREEEMLARAHKIMGQPLPGEKA